ncbi:MAG: glycosyltransferase family 2 protein [Clostridia bacterium]|nr:glycosyltransferase family 2 protein [Clostridia bacterium]
MGELVIENNTANCPLISIIVPIYKVEKYLKRCIDTILAQTYQNFELILVDDGSPDSCGAICDEYAEKDSRIRVIHQANQGQAAARNHAAKTAKGEFIVFVDSDDFVEPDCLEYLLALQKKYGTDMAIGGSGYVYEGAEPPIRPSDNKDESMDACKALVRMNYNRGCGATPWAKLYKKELILNHPFPEGQIYEDLAVLYQIVGDCSLVAIGNRKIYYWVQRAGSTMRMEFDERQMAGMDAAAAQIEYVKTRYPQALSSALYRHTAKAVELIAVCFNSGGSKDVFLRLRRLMNQHANEVLRDKRAKKTMKLRIIAVKLGYYPAKIVFHMHENAKRHRYGAGG